MIIGLSRIPPEGEHFTGYEPPDILEIENDRFIRSAGSVNYDLTAEIISNELLVRGKVFADAELCCARCSEFFSTTITDSDFLRVYPISPDTDAVNITGDLREDLLLSVPGFPVCSEKCKGLCMQCGQDLNSGKCDCRNETGSSAWGALDNLNL